MGKMGLYSLFHQRSLSSFSFHQLITLQDSKDFGTSADGFEEFSDFHDFYWNSKDGVQCNLYNS